MTTLRSALLLASVALALAGCGDGAATSPPSPDAKHNAAAYDSVDVCGLATDEQLKAALGEDAGGKERRDADGLKACAVDARSGAFYLFLTVVRPSMAPAEQIAYDKGQAEGAKDLDAATFSYAEEGQAFVETTAGDLVLRAALVYYVDSGKITDAGAVVARLRTLLGQVTRNVQ